MKKVVLYIACSMDGYIAEDDGGIDFLFEFETPTSQPDFDYEVFYNSIGALIMGGKTYRQIAFELSPEKWLYSGKPCYVYTRAKQSDDPNVTFTDLPPRSLLSNITDQVEGDIWLLGGGEIVKMFLEQNLIDRYYVYLMPVLLGSGVPLFPAGFPKTRLALESVRAIGEIVEVVYFAKR